MCRLAGGDQALSDLLRRREELGVWLEQAENAVSSLPITATDNNLRELKVQEEPKHAHTSRIHRSIEISISDAELVVFSYLLRSALTVFNFVLSPCSLHCTHDLLSVTQSQAQPVKPSKHTQREPNSHIFCFLNNAALLKRLQSLSCFCIHSFLNLSSLTFPLWRHIAKSRKNDVMLLYIEQLYTLLLSFSVTS